MAMLRLRTSSPAMLGTGIPPSIPATKLSNFKTAHPHAPKFSPFATSPRHPRRVSVSMSLQIDPPAVSSSPAPAPTPSTLDPPTVVEISLPAASLAGFEADYERVAASWPSDLATTTDDYKLEEYVSSAHALVRRWLPEKLVSRLERFIHDPKEPPALVIRGLPIDRDLPPTQPDVEKPKVGKYMSETWLVGIARVVGQVFTFDFVRGKSVGPAALVRQIYTTAEKVDQVNAEGSRELFDFHSDFFQMPPHSFPAVIVFLGLRGDPSFSGRTLLCDHRLLYRLLSPSDIDLLRTHPLTWKVSAGMQFSQHIIQGSDNDEVPRVNIFEERMSGMKRFDDLVHGREDVKAAYKRVKACAARFVDGVWLGTGDVLLLNQRKASHGREPYEAKYDGNDRWLQRTYANGGGFWEAGLAKWPRRVVSSKVQD